MTLNMFTQILFFMIKITTLNLILFFFKFLESIFGKYLRFGVSIKYEI
jgi:hypothetical protein